MTRDLADFKSAWISRANQDEPIVAELVVRDCNSPIGLTASEIATARVAPHGDFSKSNVYVMVEIRIACEGDEKELRRYFHTVLVHQLATQRETIQKLIDEKQALTDRCNQAEANLRAAALRESILKA